MKAAGDEDIVQWRNAGLWIWYHDTSWGVTTMTVNSGACEILQERPVSFFAFMNTSFSKGGMCLYHFSTAIFPNRHTS